MEGWIYVFQNFIWIPIISAVIGRTLSISIPYLWKIWKNKRKLNIDSKIDEFSISGDWNSVFIEGKDIQTEQIKIEQTGDG